MSFARVQTESRELNQVQSNIASVVNPLLSNPYLNGNILEGVSLISGTTVIAHDLGRVQQGWTIIDVDGAAAIYRSAAFNASVLSLVSDAAVTVNIYVF